MLEEMNVNCGYCHECGNKLVTVKERGVLGEPGDEYCMRCDEVKYYPTHGWPDSKANYFSPCRELREGERRKQNDK